MNEDLGYIKINYLIFKDCLLLHNIDNIPPYLIKKSDDLLNNYNCFASNFDARSLWEKKKIMATTKKNNKSRTRPHLISFDFTDETKCKKEFTSYLNKLTDVNKEIIYNKIKIFLDKINDNFIKILFNILWNFIKISSNNIYIDVLYLFNIKYIKENIKIYWDNYITNKEWLPPTDILNNKNIFNEDNYNEYCIYVKWKKNNLSLCRAWCNIFKKENILENIDDLNFKIVGSISDFKENKHIVDLLLDQINILLDIRPNKNIINKIINWDITTNCENSTKFKILNFIDKYK